jgi:hypothetical protein
VVTLGDSASTRAQITYWASGYLNECKRPGDAIGLIVEPRHDGWVIGARIHTVGIRAACGPDPDEAVVRAVLAGVLVDARKQAAVDAAVLARMRGSCRITDSRSAALNPLG